MPRKRKTSPADDMVDLVAMFPWWVGIILAVVSYFWLHHVATEPLTVVAKPGQIGDAITGGMYRALAIAGQYVLPLICVLGALVSFLGRRKRKLLFDNVAASTAASAINHMSWQEFEMLVGEAFRRKGYMVTETGGGGADGGVDLVLRKGGEKFLVQCKKWRAFNVGVSVVRELYGAMAAEGATGGFVVTSGVFSEDAKAFARGRNVELIDGAELKWMIDEARSPSRVYKSGDEIMSAPVQACPKCGGAMVRKIAKQGDNAGKAFWGCPNFPQCRGIVPID